MADWYDYLVRKEYNKIVEESEDSSMHIINLRVYDKVDMSRASDIKTHMEKDKNLTIICNDLHANIINADTVIVYGNISKGCIIEADKCLVLNGNEKYCEAVVNEKDHYDISKEKAEIKKSGESSADPNFIPNGYPGSTASYAERTQAVRVGDGTSKYKDLPKLKIHPPVEIKE